ncbi:MAG: cytochrome P450 [Betaproteobacteria bacterium]|nr:cytochrome P450 [Betaproteobacteria bacterium]
MMNDFGFDPLDPVVWQNPWPYFARGRDEFPAYRHQDTLARSVSVFRHEDVSAILKDWETFSSSSPADMNEGGLGELASLMAEDPPEHTRLRDHVRGAFSLAAVKGYAAAIERLADEILDELLERGTFDAAADYAGQLTARTILTVLGLPASDWRRIREWTVRGAANVTRSHFVREAEPEADRSVEAIFTEMAAYLDGFVHQADALPDGSLLRSLVQAAPGADRLSPRELRALAALTLLAGNETTTTLLAGAVLTLEQRPNQARALRAEPELAASAVEETLRFRPPVPALPRRATRNLTLHGVEIAKDDNIVVWLASANRDQRVFSEADQFDIRRGLSPQAISFGRGVHTCLGMPLARLEGRIGLERLYRRTRAIELLEPSPPLVLAPGVYAFERLPVRVTP